MAALSALGEDGQLARALDAAAQERMRSLVSLSDLTAKLALGYLERIGRPVKAVQEGTGAFVTVRGYAAHQAVEAAPQLYGAVDIPVLGTLPDPGRRALPQDLLSRVVKATRRGFDTIRAVPDGVWDGYVTTTTWRAHDRGEPYMERSVVDALVRFGWVLRQTDIHYGLEPQLDI
ncbi:MAG: hypothetical protein ACRDYC_09125 [Acidimicrobiales bacterium]